MDNEKKTPEDVVKGIVKFLVDVYDETGETVAIATILTMVKKREQEWVSEVSEDTDLGEHISMSMVGVPTDYPKS